MVEVIKELPGEVEFARTYHTSQVEGKARGLWSTRDQDSPRKNIKGLKAFTI